MNLKKAEKLFLFFVCLTGGVLFARSFLSVLQGVMEQPEQGVRWHAISLFVIGTLILWQVNERRLWARRLFIIFASLTWAVAFGTLVRNYSVPHDSFTALQSAEYVAFISWVAVSVLFVVFLFQHSIRDLFTRTTPNNYQRLLFAVFLAHTVYFGSDLNLTKMQTMMAQVSSPSAFSEEYLNQCIEQESGTLPSDATRMEKYCSCDAALLSRHCVHGISDRSSCLDHLKQTMDPSERYQFLRGQDRCISSVFPEEKSVILRKRRKELERVLVRQTAMRLPVDLGVQGEETQNRYVYCMSLSLLSRCEDNKLSKTYQCLSKKVKPGLVSRTKKRCEKISTVNRSEFERELSKIIETKDKPLIWQANKIVRLGPDKPEGYMLRGLHYMQKGNWKRAAEDFTIVWNTSEYPYTRAKALETRYQAHLKLGQNEKAAEDRVIACEINHPSLCDKRTNGIEILMNVDEMADYLAKALSVDSLDIALDDPTTDRSAASDDEPEEDSMKSETGSQTENNKEESEKTANKEPSEKFKTKKKNKGIPVVETSDAKTDPIESEKKLLSDLSEAEASQKGGSVWVQSLLQLSAFYQKSHDLSRAEKHVMQALDSWETLEEDSFDQLCTKGLEVAQAYVGKGESKAGEALIKKLWKQTEVASLPLQMREVNNQLVQLYGSQQRTKELEPFLRRELELAEEKFGRADPMTEVSRKTVAEYLSSQGQSKQSRAIMAIPILDLGLGKATRIEP